MSEPFFNLLTPQVAVSHWGWTIAIFLWLVGLSGMSLFLNYWLRSRNLLLLATLSAVAGSLVVVTHLTRWWNLPRAVWSSLVDGHLNFASWMLIGICLLGILCVLTVVSAWGICPKNTRPWSVKPALFLVNAIVGLGATAYSGFLLTAAVGVPFWGTASLPILWLFSGLSAALGLAEILSSRGQLDTITEPGPNGFEEHLNLTRWGQVAHIGEAFVIFAFLLVALQGTPGARAGAAAMLSGHAALLFWGGAVVLGLVVPVLTSFAGPRGRIVALGGVCALVGALCLRAAVLFAGYFDPSIL